VTGHKQTTDGGDSNGYTTAYAYNLAGALIEETYPSGRKVKNTLDSNGDLAMVQSGKCLDATPATNATCTNRAGYWSYANSFTYNPAGAVTLMQLGNGRWESTVFNSRLQPTQIALGTVQNGTDKLLLNYSYGDWNGTSIDATKNNGDIVQQVITVPTVGTSSGFVATQKYYYDELNRIDDAVETIGGSQTWRQDFSYDRYGNRNFVEANTTTLPKNCGTSPNFVVCTADKKVSNPSISPNTNRLIQDQDNDSVNDYLFDTSGNTTKDADGRTFVYDGENKQVEVKDASNNIIGQYFYNGDGQRVKKIVPATGEVTVFVYDAAAKLVAEYSTQVASQQDAKVAYLTNDHLGSPRINSDQNGSVTARHDYHPFGEEIATSQRIMGLGYAADTIRKQYTSCERDTETELDFAQARYYSNQHGRFISTDPLYIELRRLADPQKINLYVYARNNPLLFIDPNGLEVTVNDKTTDGTGDDDYKKIVNGRKDAKFQVDINNKNKVIIVDAKGNALSKSDLKALGKTLKDGEKGLFNAITDTKNNATVNIVRDDPDIFFGAYEKKGENTIDVGDANKLNDPKNVGGRAAYDSVAHETLEAFYTVSKNISETAAHQQVNAFFPGLGLPINTGRITTPNRQTVVGWRGDFPVAGQTNTYEQIEFTYVTPIPANQYTQHSGKGVNIKSVKKVP
jgi:RHS repeat-associated protein